jgi:hypothetical protein
LTCVSGHQTPFVLLPYFRVEKVQLDLLVSAIDKQLVPNSGQQLVEGGHAAEDRRTEAWEEPGGFESMLKIAHGIHGAQIGSPHHDQAIDVRSPLPSQLRQGTVRGQVGLPIAHVIARDEAAHGVGNNVEVVALLEPACDRVRFFQLFRLAARTQTIDLRLRGLVDFLAPLLDEVAQANGILHVVPAPVVEEGEAAVVILSVQG